MRLIYLPRMEDILNFIDTLLQTGLTNKPVVKIFPEPSDIYKMECAVKDKLPQGYDVFIQHNPKVHQVTLRIFRDPKDWSRQGGTTTVKRHGMDFMNEISKLGVQAKKAQQ